MYKSKQNDNYFERKNTGKNQTLLLVVNFKSFIMGAIINFFTIIKNISYIYR